MGDSQDENIPTNDNSNPENSGEGGDNSEQKNVVDNLQDSTNGLLENVDEDLDNVPGGQKVLKVRPLNVKCRPETTDLIYGPSTSALEIERLTPSYLASQATIDEGHRLYQCHFRREVRLKGLLIPQFMLNGRRPINMNNLIALADQFRASQQRVWVYEQAESVDLESLNFQTFCDLLGGLFQEGGVTWERVLVLFFFCTDLSIRAFRESLSEYFYRVHDWATSYIGNILSYWVEQQGGWDAVLARSVNHVTRLAVLTLCCFSIVALAIYIRRNRLS